MWNKVENTINKFTQTLADGQELPLDVGVAGDGKSMQDMGAMSWLAFAKHNLLWMLYQVRCPTQGPTPAPTIFSTYFMPLTFERHVPFRVLGEPTDALSASTTSSSIGRTGGRTASEWGVFVIHIVSLIPFDACRISFVRRHEGFDILIEIPIEIWSWSGACALWKWFWWNLSSEGP